LTELTSSKTKSGTIIYARGGSREVRSRAIDDFLKYYNRDFTIQEQRTIGNIWYDVQTGKKKITGRKPIAETGTFVNKDIKTLNPGRKKMVDTTFAPDVRKDEPTIVHEMIHAKKFMQGIPGKRHNERKIDFEVIGRLSRSGLKDHMQHGHGYYYHPKGNRALAELQISNQEKQKIASKGVLHDRNLLTGSINKSITGKTAVSRAETLFRQSFLNKRKL